LKIRAMGEEITLFLKIRSFLLSHNVNCTGRRGWGH
jgi:hypothetical protein